VELKRHQDALESFDKALELDAEYADAWNSRSIVLCALGRLAEALESFDRALELDPKNAVAWNGRGMALYDLQRLAEALESFDRALELDPKNAVAWNNRGGALDHLGRLAEALESFDRASELDPKNAYVWFNRAELFLGWKHREEFITELERAFQNAEFSDDRRGDTAAYCRLILTDVAALEQWPEHIGTLVGIYEKYGALLQLGLGVAASIPALFAPTVAEFTAERWNAAWQAAGKNKPALEIPLRLLNAAVRWRKQPDRRVLLSLPAEERHVLEELLPDEKPPA
jgi:tetratricopeptide (TPR) repeat protein